MSSAMVGNGYQQNYNTYNGQPAPNQGQNVMATGVLSNSDEHHQNIQEFLGSQRQREYNQMLQKQDGYHEPHPSSRPPANEQQYYSSSPSQPQSVQKLLAVKKQIESEMKELQIQSGEEEENTEDEQDEQKKGIHKETNRKKKLPKRKNIPRELIVHKRGLQTPPWAEHFDVKEIKTADKVGHGNEKSMNLSEQKGILEEQPWYQNHQKNRRVTPIEKESSKNHHHHEKYEPSQLSQSEGRSWNKNKNDLERSHGRNKYPHNQTDESKLNGQKHSNPVQKGPQTGSYPENKGQRSVTRESESHLWNNTRRMQYNKNHPWNEQQSQDISLDDYEQQTRGQGQQRENRSFHPSQQGEHRQSRGHLDNGQRVEGHQDEGLQRKCIDQKQGSQAKSQERKKYENQSDRGQIDRGQSDRAQWDKSQWDEGQLSKAQLEKNHKEEINYRHSNNQQEEDTTEEGKHFDDFMPFGGMLRRRKVDPVTLKSEFLEETRKSYKELTMKEQNPSPRRMPTPPHGLDIVSQSERTRQAREKQRQYGQELQKQTQEQMFKKIQNNISVIDRTGQLPEAPNQYNHVAPQQHAIPPPQQHASPSSRNIAPQHPPPQTASPPPPQHHKMLPHPPQHSQMLPPPTQHTQMYPPQQHPSQMLPPQSPRKPPQLHHTQMSNSYAEHHQATPAGSRSPPPRQRSHPTPQRTEHGYHPEYNGKQQSSIESRDGHRPPPHPRRHATPDRPDWARGPPPRQDGTPTGRSSFRRDDRQTPSYWNGGIPVRSPATTPSTRTPSTQHSNRTLTPKDSQENIPDIHLESYRKNPFEENRRGERNREYNEFLSQKEVKAQSKREQIDNLRRQPAVQPKFDKYASSDSHQQHRKQLESELRDQYQSFLSQNGEPVYTSRNPNSELTLSRLSGGLSGGIFGDVQHEQDRRRVMVQQRNKEYNQLKTKSYSREPQHEYSRKGPELGLPLDNKKSNELRRRQEKDRNQEYRSFLEEKKRSPRRYHPPTPEDKQGLPLTQRPYDEMKAINEKQRNMEYNQYLAKTGLPFDKMSLQGSVQGSALARQVNGHHSETEQPTPQKRYPSKKHDREVTHRVEEETKQQPANRSKEFWSSNDNPKIYPTSGEYRRRGEKMKEELREEFHVFMDKQEQPKERKKVFGEQGSVLFVSQYPDTKKHMNAERKRDMLEHLEKKKGEVPRRQGDPSMDEKNMFSDLGKSQDAHKKKIHENAKQDYRNYVDHAFPEGLNRGEPTFAARKAPPDSWYDAQPPTHRRSPPRDYRYARPDQENHQRHNHDAYAERLDQARANEALYRKHDHQMNDHGHRQPPPSQAQAPYALY
ncbi:serine/arginine repetitive matrix protein 1-like isoform X2 [Mizuhopecten yessoensis]|uniref:serine/arginine repetitive matrix protein 1-like isoform X2 n=1 Tax=Mizuhopecten yessoensis TaxID=6573 RepID=UPI000B45A608|nr:serine/arginine repetitive matrix protein 1-like isoform X2 [Mizuhopecten yessoensis]